MGTKRNIWHPSLDGKSSATIYFRKEKVTVFLGHKSCTWRYVYKGTFGQEEFTNLDDAFAFVENKYDINSAERSECDHLPRSISGPHWFVSEPTSNTYAIWVEGTKVSTYCVFMGLDGNRWFVVVGGHEEADTFPSLVASMEYVERKFHLADSSKFFASLPRFKGGFFHDPPKASISEVYGWTTVLGVVLPCTVETVKASYNELALAHHPDRGGSLAEMTKINEAWEEACDYFSNAVPHMDQKTTSKDVDKSRSRRPLPEKIRKHFYHASQLGHAMLKECDRILAHLQEFNRLSRYFEKPHEKRLFTGEELKIQVARIKCDIEPLIDNADEILRDPTKFWIYFEDELPEEDDDDPMAVMDEISQYNSFGYIASRYASLIKYLQARGIRCKHPITIRDKVVP